MIRRLTILLLIVGCVFAQQYKVVVILQNGSEIHGIIIEEKPNEYIKIQSGKNLFVFEFDEIELLTKELVKDKTWSFAGGFGTNRSLSLLGISKDFRIGNNFSFFLTAGIGTAMPGLGFAYQSDYNNNGINFSATIGLQEYYKSNHTLDKARPSINSALNCQWKLNNNLFISLGIMGGMFWDRDDVCYNGWSCESRIGTKQYILPTISFDFRF